MSSSEEVGGGGDGGNGGGGGTGGGPSSSRTRRGGGNGVWPEPFLEALASQIAIDASLSTGRLAAAQAISGLFQVCSTWRAVSRSDLLWQNLTLEIWNRRHLLRQTWHDEYVYWHQTSNNFRQHGDIHVAVISGATPPRRAHLGDVVNDGALVDFTGCDHWWVGLYAGVPGRAFHIWNSETEELIYVGGDLTDPEAVMGWHLLTELTELVARIRIATQDTAVACTGLRLVVINLRNQGLIIQERSFQQVLIVGSFDATNELLVAVDGQGVATVLRVEDLEEACRFNVRGASQRGVVGCMNSSGYAVMYVGGVIRVWAVQNGVYLYSLRERIGEVNATLANQRHIVACSSDGTIHLWDFGAQ
ncbi:PREDICTED: transcriptional regulator STERILE APETALA-like isoform X2 [Nicotiana attenuata]|uniref:transcriptional regulator STERILE APETALA-like isoform X2 n=1 Tax=Nicotiana attenuata TaxID=49451 RepID=UPI0009046191|nr:PREDICTED: transcriptional regulator STERILE APETALA-like isoform X2 [Nicotiana attenuata]